MAGNVWAERLLLVGVPGKGLDDILVSKEQYLALGSSKEFRFFNAFTCFPWITSKTQPQKAQVVFFINKSHVAYLIPNLLARDPLHFALRMCSFCMTFMTGLDSREAKRRVAMLQQRLEPWAADCNKTR